MSFKGGDFQWQGKIFTLPTSYYQENASPCSLQPTVVPALLQTKQYPALTLCLPHRTLHLPDFTPIDVMKSFTADFDGSKIRPVLNV